MAENTRSLALRETEYENEDAIVTQMFQEAWVKAGVVKNLTGKYYKNSAYSGGCSALGGESWQ